ncbi:hypothetical protein FB45DRAFT_1052507 [Roridomyces roridus]|uniref:F-box domain-containing protein n=1 Tax=Roridomyces roridus TaxID=1738132 RepID=A0AAD7CA26_9AGAR|nr:hypothetical protein FB45DRAFT_1052507 [Roridomyces roridus]
MSTILGPRSPLVSNHRRLSDATQNNPSVLLPTPLSTVGELHKRIGAISAAIERQQDGLRVLERQKSDALGDLNSLLDPMAKLPLGISSEILLESLSSTRSMQASTALLGICRSWSDVALATPSLWTHFSNLTVTTPEGSSPPHITLSVHPPHRQHVGSQVRESTKLFRECLRLTPHLEDLAIMNCQNNLPAFFETLNNNDIHPVLTHLAAQGSGVRGAYHVIPDVVTERSAMLASFQFVCVGADGDDLFEEFVGSFRPLADEGMQISIKRQDWFFTSDIHTDSRTPPHDLTHTSLQHLKLGDSYKHCNILQYLTLPALQTLFILDSDIIRSDLSPLLQRSSPPLRSLSLKSENYEDGDIEEYLRLVPSLIDLAIRFDSDCAIIVFELFACRQDLLPNLRSLTIRIDHLDSMEHGTVVDLLDARCDGNITALASAATLCKIFDYKNTVLTTAGGSGSDNAAVLTDPFVNAANQEWFIIPQSTTGTFTLQSVAHPTVFLSYAAAAVQAPDHSQLVVSSALPIVWTMATVGGGPTINLIDTNTNYSLTSWATADPAWTAKIVPLTMEPPVSPPSFMQEFTISLCASLSKPWITSRVNRNSMPLKDNITALASAATLCTIFDYKSTVLTAGSGSDNTAVTTTTNGGGTGRDDQWFIIPQTTTGTFTLQSRADPTAFLSYAAAAIPIPGHSQLVVSDSLPTVWRMAAVAGGATVNLIDTKSSDALTSWAIADPSWPANNTPLTMEPLNSPKSFMQAFTVSLFAFTHDQELFRVQGVLR